MLLQAVENEDYPLMQALFPADHRRGAGGGLARDIATPSSTPDEDAR